MTNLPSNCLVGFITFGKNVYIHQLYNNELQTITCVRGTKSYTDKEIERVLRLTDKNGNKTTMISKYIASLENCDIILNDILDNINHDDWNQETNKRPEIATGIAVQCSIALATQLVGQVGCCRIILMTSGACTVGSGKIVDIPYDKKLRMYHDIYNKDVETIK